MVGKRVAYLVQRGAYGGHALISDRDYLQNLQICGDVLYLEEMWRVEKVGWLMLVDSF